MLIQPFDEKKNHYTGFFILYPQQEGQDYDHWLSEAKKDAAEYDHFSNEEEGVAFCKEKNISLDYVVPVQWIFDMT